MSENVVEFEVLGQFYKGDKGDPGVILLSSEVLYQISDSGTAPPTGPWSPTLPVVPQGSFLWVRTIETYNSGDPVISTWPVHQGLDGSGSVVSVAHITPDGNGNVPLVATDIGAVASVAGVTPDSDGNVPLTAKSLSAATASDLKKLEKTVREGLEAVRTVHTSTLAADGWEGDDAPFTQRVSVEGLTAADTPHVGPAEITSDELEESCRMITGVKALDGALLVTCRTDKPTVDIPIQVEVIR